MKVVIASQNPVKIQATKDGFQTYFKDEIDFVGISVSSGVGKQPIGDAQTFQGALNRTLNAQKSLPDADYWVGIEGGVEWEGEQMRAFAWMIIKTKTGQIGKGKTGTFYLPNKVVQLIKAGKELGEADDIVFGKKDSKLKMGAVGILTKGKITRTSYYTDAIKLALINFINKEFYE